MKRHTLIILFSLLITAVMAQSISTFITAPDVTLINTVADRQQMGLKGNVKSCHKKSVAFNVEIEYVDFQPIKSAPQEYLVTFNEQGNILCNTGYRYNVATTELINEYNDAGYILKSTKKYLSANNAGTRADKSFIEIRIPPTTTIFSYTKGKQLAEIRTFNDETNELMQLTTCTYHPNGCLEEAVTVYNPGSEKPVSTRKTYNQQGLCTFDDNGRGKTEKAYDKNGNMVESRYYGSYNGCEIITFTYDKHNNPTERRQRYEPNPEGYAAAYVELYKYDKSGTLVKNVSYQENENGKKTSPVVEYLFDKRKNIGTRMAADGKVTYRSTETKKGDNTLHTAEYYSNGVLAARKESLTSPQGLLLSHIDVNNSMADGPYTTETSYQYDSYGNVTKEECYVNGKLKTAYEYKLEYY